MPLHRCSDSLAMSGLQRLEDVQRVGARRTGRRARWWRRCSRWCGDERAQQLDVARSARRPSARGRSRSGWPPARSTWGHTARSELSTSSTARGSSLTNRHLALGQARQAGLEARPRGRGRRRRRARRGPRRPRAAPGRAARPCPCGRGSAPRGRRRVPSREVDERLEDRGQLALGEELREPVGARAVEQRLGRQRQRRTASSSRTANSSARSALDRSPISSRSRSPQPGPQMQHALDGHVGALGLVAEVLELEQDGRPVREQPDAFGGGGLHLVSIGTLASGQT